MKKLSPEILEKLKGIKAVVFDVDGVLTDGKITYDNKGMEFKSFNVKDGQIIKHLRKNNILTGVITGRDSRVVRNRCEELKIDFHHHGIEDKFNVFFKEMSRRNIAADQVAYIGDDINDLPVLRIVGLSATPADGHYKVKEEVDLVLSSEGGKGAVRELADLILEATGTYDLILKKQ
ncbi:KdsC family phosphatase [Roseivirga misakiensis]|uniref:3-deoxy-manno-octulosonate-8-phosphatase n=1 Tax=Roseivirga misakiensis TaxID=1563681 RepID=A0A1E5T1J9_9BACT|nr:HAD hydrolase family protein [Roseivirga misakiensis]OEK05236.1 3-deoxy-manno-octulosonate-8-phosphatase [Roseivirga misakiensis]